MDYLSIQEDALIEVSRMQRKAGMPLINVKETSVRQNLKAMEESLALRSYPTKKERDAYRNGFSDGAALTTKDDDPDYPNAYSAGYWDGFHHVAGENP